MELSERKEYHMKNAVRAVVQSVFPSKNGRIAKAWCESERCAITFSLKKPVWKLADEPGAGTTVKLSGLYQQDGRWRARSARFTTLAEERLHGNQQTQGNQEFEQC